MGRVASEQGACGVRFEIAGGETGGGAYRLHAESGHRNRVLRNAQRRREQLIEERACVRDEFAKQLPVGRRVLAERAGGFLERAVHDRALAAVERMGQRDFRMDEF